MAIHENTGDHCLGLASTLNQASSCVTLNSEALHHTLESDAELHGLYRSLAEQRPYLFAQIPYFVSRRQIERMAELIHAIESVVALPAYQERALSWAPETARYRPGPLGVFFGYDFHLQGADPRLIEINTNAGGALLNTRLVKAQRASSQAVNGRLPLRDTVALVEQDFVDKFRCEWRRQRGDVPLQSIAIVDEDPEGQYLSPEFRLFERLFQRNGIAAVVADPSELTLRADGLWYRDLKIDLIYNRLTDFSLGEPSNAGIRAAYMSGQVVLTPHPHAHALYADKRNLTLLTDDDLLRTWGVPESIRRVLRTSVPHTVLVTRENCEALWSRRRRLFFKPAAGYGGKAAYRGDKITRRVWQDILAGEYVAQELVPPSQRKLYVDGSPVVMKVDVRNYVYEGRVQLLAARMYQGQATNFRTAGGGFATVFEIDDARSCVLQRVALDSHTPISANPFHFFDHGQPFIRG